MTSKKILVVVSLLFLAIGFNGCITTQSKQYDITLNGKGGGKAVIKYYNIMGDAEAAKDDFKSLISDYYMGSSIEDEFPNATILSKELYQDGEVLSGTVEIEFKDVKDLKLFQYDGNSPIMMYVNSMNETYVESNGTYDENVMPVVFWSKDTKTISLKTNVAGEIAPDDTSKVSMLAPWKEWKAKMK